jgi:hypothetical protein
MSEDFNRYPEDVQRENHAARANSLHGMNL